ncbi:ankyrin repeat domain-containing protein [Streptomyces sp. DT2A-34]|uniref:ankyrin repeat domain-containing protein n=1 Tax=Streptomyces sp. DT2A-34 TaxID=3051182 RepID=UPI00265B75E4|nr:ankyrin repeat domain-containing protein [Streptomyces sp. DT2A-34]MDO0911334.1 ankyrin repeat domain-containing protein [Streptomyces sp. DT2A-34]
MAGQGMPMWDGTTRRDVLPAADLAVRDRLADAARDGNWYVVLQRLHAQPALANSPRPGGASGYAALHQAAWHGVSPDTIRLLKGYGAWSSLRASDGSRPVDIATQRGHRHLADLLQPQVHHPLPPQVLAGLQQQLHRLLHYRADGGTGQDPVGRLGLRLPQPEVLTELAEPVLWFPIPGAGGFTVRLEGNELSVASAPGTGGASEERVDRVTANVTSLAEGRSL